MGQSKHSSGAGGSEWAVKSIGQVRKTGRSAAFKSVSVPGVVGGRLLLTAPGERIELHRSLDGFPSISCNLGKC